MMLAALPGTVGDGRKALAASTKAEGQETFVGAKLNNDRVRRFLTGPSGCEITGVTITPDYKAIFVNVQHPGGAWPANQSERMAVRLPVKPWNKRQHKKISFIKMPADVGIFYLGLLL